MVLTVSEISFMMTSQMVAAIWIGMRIFPLVQTPPVLSGGERQYAESPHRGIFRLLYSNGIEDTIYPRAGLYKKETLA